MSAKDPVAPQNIIRFNFKERQYKLDATVDQCSCHFEMEGNLLHRDTEDGKKIVAEQEAKRVAQERAQEMAGLSGGGEGGEVGEPKKLRNQFNYSERASQTFNHPPRVRETMTEPPPSIGFNGQVCESVNVLAAKRPRRVTRWSLPIERRFESGEWLRSVRLVCRGCGATENSKGKSCGCDGEEACGQG